MRQKYLLEALMSCAEDKGQYVSFVPPGGCLMLLFSQIESSEIA